jgi:hypothetical protein
MIGPRIIPAERRLSRRGIGRRFVSADDATRRLAFEPRA